jgi:hypothetical protein
VTSFLDELTRLPYEPSRGRHYRYRAELTMGLRMELPRVRTKSMRSNSSRSACL